MLPVPDRRRGGAPARRTGATSSRRAAGSSTPRRTSVSGQAIWVLGPQDRADRDRPRRGRAAARADRSATRCSAAATAAATATATRSRSPTRWSTCKRDLSRGADVELVRVTTDRPATRPTCGSRCSNTFDGSAWRPSSRDIPVKQRADGAVPRPPGLGTSVATRSRSPRDDHGQHELPVPLAADALPGRARSRRRATGATTASTLDFISAADNQTTAGPDLPASRAIDLAPTAAELADATPGAGVGLHAEHRAAPRPARVGAQAGPHRHRRAAHEVRAGRRAAAVVPGRRRLPLLPGALRGQRHRRPGGIPGHRQGRPGRLLRAVRRRDGADGPQRSASPRGWRSASCVPRRSTRTPTSTAPTTCTPGRRCTSAASAGCASSRPRGPRHLRAGLHHPAGAADRRRPSSDRVRAGRGADPQPHRPRRRRAAAGADSGDGSFVGGPAGDSASLARAAGARAGLALAPRSAALRWCGGGAGRAPTGTRRAGRGGVAGGARHGRGPRDRLGRPGHVRTAARDLVRSFGRPGPSRRRARRRAEQRGARRRPEATAALDRIVLLVERVRYARNEPARGRPHHAGARRRRRCASPPSRRAPGAVDGAGPPGCRRRSPCAAGSGPGCAVVRCRPSQGSTGRSERAGCLVPRTRGPASQTDG